MSGQYKPSLGDWVHFSHFHEKPTRAEVNDLGENSEDDGSAITISYMRRENPAPDWVTALVVGVQSVEATAPVQYADDPGTWFVSWGHQQGAPHRTFYVVKHTLRGRRYLVALEDIRQQQNGGSPL